MQSNTRSEKREILTFRLPSAMLQELRQRAVEEDRSLGGMVRVAVREMLSSEEAK